jgi:hypothetical protein
MGVEEISFSTDFHNVLNRHNSPQVKYDELYAYPGKDGHYSDRDVGLCNKGTYKRGPGFMDLKLTDVASEQPLCSVMFAGNKHESRFLKPPLEDFHMRCGCYPLFLLGDKAFFSFENVLYCIVRGLSWCWTVRRSRQRSRGRWRGFARPVRGIIRGRRTTPRGGCLQGASRKRGSGRSWLRLYLF